MKDDKIFYLRSRKNDDQLTPSQLRTYIEPFMMFFVLISLILIVVTGFVSEKFFSFQFFQLSKLYLTNIKKLKEYGIYEKTSVYLSVIYIMIISLSAWISMKLNKPINYVSIVDNGLKYYLKNGLEEYKKNQVPFEKDAEVIQLLNKKIDGEDLYLDQSTKELGIIITGEAGSGKGVLNNRFLEDNINKGEKVIYHEPKGDNTPKFIKADVSVAVIAPWLEHPACKYIDYSKLIYSDNMEKTKLMINQFVYSFAGFKNPKKEDFFPDSAKTILIALTRKVVDKYKDKWSLFDWISLVEKNLTVDKLKDVLEEFSPESANIIDKEAPKQTAGVLASMVPTLTKIKLLALMWKDSKKAFDLREWLYSKKPAYQFISLYNSTTYSDVASSVIASFINLASILVIDIQYLERGCPVLYFNLDEFNSFARYIDMDIFKNLPDLGRQAGIRLVVLFQRKSQVHDFIESTKKAEDNLGSYQSKIYCRPASSDLSYIKDEVGSHNEIHTEFTKSHNAQGSNLTSKTTEKLVQFESTILTTQLGPIPAKKDRKKGVYVALNTVSNPVVARVLIPFKEFCKERIEDRKAKGIYKGKDFKPEEKEFSRELMEIDKKLNLKVALELKLEEVRNSKIDDEEKDKLIESIETQITNLVSELNVFLGIELPEEAREESIVEGVAKEIALDSMDHTGALTLINQATELLESLEEKNLNSDTHSIDEKGDVKKTKKKSIVREIEK